MAGITAVSVSKTHGSGATSAAAVVSGFSVGEQITLGITEASATFAWGFAKPSGSAGAVDLTDDTIAAPSFIPDVFGPYVVTVTTAATTYTLQINVADYARVDPVDGVRFSPVPAASVPAPSIGLTMFCNSSNSDALSVKAPDGTVSVVDLT
jgi:hypothetical protein